MAKKSTPKIKIEPESLSSQAHAAFGGHLSSQFSQQYNEFSAAQEKFNQEMDRALYPNNPDNSPPERSSAIGIIHLLSLMKIFKYSRSFFWSL